MCWPKTVFVRSSPVRPCVCVCVVCLPACSLRCDDHASTLKFPDDDRVSLTHAIAQQLDARIVDANALVAIFVEPADRAHGLEPVVALVDRRLELAVPGHRGHRDLVVPDRWPVAVHAPRLHDRPVDGAQRQVGALRVRRQRGVEAVHQRGGRVRRVAVARGHLGTTVAARAIVFRHAGRPTRPVLGHLQEQADAPTVAAAAAVGQPRRVGQVQQRFVQIVRRGQPAGVGAQVALGPGMRAPEPGRHDQPEHGQPVLETALVRVPERAPPDAVVAHQHHDRAVQLPGPVERVQEAGQMAVAVPRILDVVVRERGRPEHGHVRAAGHGQRGLARVIQHGGHGQPGPGARHHVAAAVTAHRLLGAQHERPKIVVGRFGSEPDLAVVERADVGRVLREYRVVAGGPEVAPREPARVEERPFAGPAPGPQLVHRHAGERGHQVRERVVAHLVVAEHLDVAEPGQQFAGAGHLPAKVQPGHRVDAQHQHAAGARVAAAAHRPDEHVVVTVNHDVAPRALHLDHLVRHDHIALEVDSLAESARIGEHRQSKHD